MHRTSVGSSGSLNQPRGQILVEAYWVLKCPLQLVQSWIWTSNQPSDAEFLPTLLKQHRNAAEAHLGEKSYLAFATQRSEPPFPD